MGYWNSKVVPRFKKIFEKNSAKKAAAAEACKTFDESKETINKEIEEKKTELQPKVVETYEATSAEVKALVRDPKEAGLKKNSAAVLKYLEALVGIGNGSITYTLYHVPIINTPTTIFACLLFLSCLIYKIIDYNQIFASRNFGFLSYILYSYT
ncbi:BnaCnng39730D [Brassica napus]|uniref:BnaCnng39730D protein n=1 Tax=Brassica napus TaxID=3708 RepID=A0A078JAC3_BRANA|nr:BnaCnng39730D [Brassica napus]